MLYIFLPVHNRKIITEVFIKSLSKQSCKDFQLILIDDGSTDGTSEMVLGHLPNTVVIKGDGNLWWAGALQLAYEWVVKNLYNEVCLIINDDVAIDDNFILKGLNLVDANENILVLAQAYSLDGNQLLDKGVHFNYKKLSFQQANSKLKINCLSTRGLFLTATAFKEIGGFYPRILPHYLSDYEFTIRAERKGFKLITSSDLKLRVNQETTGFHGIEFDGIIKYYSKFFSNRNALNPKHWFFFVLLTNPFPYNLINAFKVIVSGFNGLIYPLKFFIKFKK